ncbi:MAG TPA: hypothetical protein VK826_19240 [Bacteroidia bacterium]|nr:hypothetical protein [Bacteroidia bacterium]
MIKALTNGPVSGARINRTAALALVSRYKAIQHDTIKNKLGYYDSIYVWFSIDTLRTFLEEMDTLQGHEVSGVRVYFGTMNTPQPEKASYHNKHTVVFVCTEQIEGTSCHVELIDNSEETPEEGYNFGSLCPPECNHCACDELSLAKEVFGETPCDM